MCHVSRITLNLFHFPHYGTLTSASDLVDSALRFPSLVTFHRGRWLQLSPGVRPISTSPFHPDFQSRTFYPDRISLLLYNGLPFGFSQHSSKFVGCHVSASIGGIGGPNRMAPTSEQIKISYYTKVDFGASRLLEFIHSLEDLRLRNSGKFPFAVTLWKTSRLKFLIHVTLRLPSHSKAQYGVLSLQFSCSASSHYNSSDVRHYPFVAGRPSQK